MTWRFENIKEEEAIVHSGLMALSALLRRLSLPLPSIFSFSAQCTIGTLLLGLLSVLYERHQSMGTMQRVADASGLLRDFGRLAHPNRVCAFMARQSYVVSVDFRGATSDNAIECICPKF